jgi:hypothetical protein
MTRRLVGVLVAGATAFGLASGAAGTIVAHDTTTPSRDFVALMADHMADFDKGSMLSGSMMGPGGSYGPGMMAGEPGSMRGGLHGLHHPISSPDGSK